MSAFVVVPNYGIVLGFPDDDIKDVALAVTQMIRWGTVLDVGIRSEEAGRNTNRLLFNLGQIVSANVRDSPPEGDDDGAQRLVVPMKLVDVLRAALTQRANEAD